MSEYNKKVYSMKKDIEVYCPVRKAKLEIGSEQLEEMNEFTKYILYLLGTGYNIERISDVLELGEFIVREEVEYIIKIGLATIDNNQYNLTELGNIYFNLMRFLEDIKDDINVNVNCFNGLIVDDYNDLVEMDKCKEEIYKLRVKIVKELYLNKNVSNSKDYFVRKFQQRIKLYLSEKEIEKLYVNVNFIRGDYFKEIYIDTAGIIEETYTELELLNNDMILVHSIIPFTLNISIKELDKYRYILPTLKKISDFQYDLISDVSYKFIYLEKEEIEINKLQSIFYYDVLTGQVTKCIGETVNSNAISNIRLDNFDKKVTISKEKINELLKENEWFNKYDFESSINELELKEYYEPTNLLNYL